MGMSCENEEKYWRKWEKNGLERDDMMKNFFFSFFIDGEMYCGSYLGKKNLEKKLLVTGWFFLELREIFYIFIMY